MDRRENNKYNMYKTVLSVLDENIEIVIKVESFQNVYKNFKSNLEKLSIKDNLYLTASKGLTNQKNNAKNNLNEALLPVANALFVYADTTRNENLKALSDIKRSSYEKLRHAEFLQKAKSIYKCLIENSPVMTGYNLSQESAETLKNRIAAYEASLMSKESRSNDSKVARKELKETFNETDRILHENLDKIIEVVKKDNPDFYRKYFSSRGIKDTGRPRKSHTPGNNTPDAHPGIPGL